MVKFFSKEQTPNLSAKNLLRARKMLFDVIEILDKNNIIYHLEGGTLLGLVRDKELLPWDHDVDISIPYHEVEKFNEVLTRLYKKGYKVSKRKSFCNTGPFLKGQQTLFKVKKFIPSIIKFVFPWYKKQYIVLDIFVKAQDIDFTYWQAQGKLMRVDNKHYESYETISYRSTILKVPNAYKEYLTKKYGDWTIPIKEWECGKDEKTICKKVC